MNYSLDWKNKGFYIKLFGLVNISHVHEVNEILYTRPEFDNAKFQLWDFNEIDDVEINDEMIEGVEILSIMDKVAMSWNNKMKIAFVAEKEVVVFLANKYISEINNTNWSGRIFSNFGEAQEWCLL